MEVNNFKTFLQMVKICHNLLNLQVRLTQLQTAMYSPWLPGWHSQHGIACLSSLVYFLSPCWGRPVIYCKDFFCHFPFPSLAIGPRLWLLLQWSEWRQLPSRWYTSNFIPQSLILTSHILSKRGSIWHRAMQCGWVALPHWTRIAIRKIQMKVIMLARVQRKVNPVGKHVNECNHYKRIAVSILKISQPYSQCIHPKVLTRKRCRHAHVDSYLFTEFNCGISLLSNRWMDKGSIHANMHIVILFSNKRIEFCPL